MVMPADDQYQREVVKSVRDDRVGYTVEFEPGHTMTWLGDKPLPFDVVPGDVIRLYGKGMGYSIRGIAVEGKGVLRYMTPAEEQAENARRSAEYTAKKEQELADSLIERNARIKAMPPEFQQRIARFVRVRPNWRRDHESYELFCCEQAIALANFCITDDTLQSFNNLKWEEQRVFWPGLSDAHSGNSFGASVMLAHVYLTEPQLIPHAHGALHFLTGCEEYGCYAATQDMGD